MGLKCAPNFAQQAMENVLQGINDSKVYLDNIECFSNERKHHLRLLYRVLTALQANVFTINPRKCEWTIQETDWLGYCLTPEGLSLGIKQLTQYYVCIDPETLSRCKVY